MKEARHCYPFQCHHLQRQERLQEPEDDLEQVQVDPRRLQEPEELLEQVVVQLPEAPLQPGPVALARLQEPEEPQEQVQVDPGA